MAKTDLSAFTSAGSGLGEALSTEIGGLQKGVKLASAQASQEIAGREFDVSPHRKKLAQEAGFGKTISEISKNISDIDLSARNLKKEIDQLRLGKPTTTLKTTTALPEKFGETDTVESVGIRLGKTATEIANAINEGIIEKDLSAEGFTKKQKTFFGSPASTTVSETTDNKELIAKKRKQLVQLFISGQKARRRFNKEIPGLSQLREMTSIALQKQKATKVSTADKTELLKFWDKRTSKITKGIDDIVSEWVSKAKSIQKRDPIKANIYRDLASTARSMLQGNVIGSGTTVSSVNDLNVLTGIARQTDGLLNNIDGIITADRLSDLVPSADKTELLPDSLLSRYNERIERLLKKNKVNLSRFSESDQKIIKKQQGGRFLGTLDKIRSIMGKVGQIEDVNQSAEFGRMIEDLAETLTLNFARFKVKEKFRFPWEKRELK